MKGVDKSKIRKSSLKDMQLARQRDDGMDQVVVMEKVLSEKGLK